MLSRVSDTRIALGLPHYSRWSGLEAAPSVVGVRESDSFVERQEWLDRLGVVLREARKAAGYTQARAAIWMSVDESAFTRWEDGRNALSAYDLARLVYLYGFDPDLAVNPPRSKAEIRRRLGPVADAVRRAGKRGLLRPLSPEGEGELE